MERGDATKAPTKDPDPTLDWLRALRLATDARFVFIDIDTFVFEVLALIAAATP